VTLRQGPHAVCDWTPQTKLPEDSSQCAYLVIHGAIGHASSKTLPLILSNVVRVYVAHKTLSKFFLEMRDTLLVPLCAFRSKPGLTGQPNISSIREERHSLTFGDVIEGLL
jgi:hypothetical protein